jgi:hypothetical protein
MWDMDMDIHTGIAIPVITAMITVITAIVAVIK